VAFANTHARAGLSTGPAPYDKQMSNKRGMYAKGTAKKAEILDTALEIVARNGYNRATVKEIADAVGLSQNGLLHYFGSKDALFTEVVQRRGEIDDRDFGSASPPSSEAEFVEGISRLVRHNTETPGFTQLYSRLSNDASQSEHAGHHYFEEHYRISREATAEAFRALQSQGSLDSTLDADKLAVLLWAVTDGLQTQWLFDPTMNMPEHVEYFLKLVGLAR